MVDVGLTHVALPVRALERSVAFYRRFAAMSVVHERVDPIDGVRVAWLSDRTRPFVIVLLEIPFTAVLAPPAHLGVGCASRAAVDDLCRAARAEGCLVRGPEDAGPPVGYWAFLRDPDGHSLELSFGQEVGLTVAGTNPPRPQ